MTKVSTKRSRPQKWAIAWYRGYGQFKNGERKMETVPAFRPKTYKSLQMAMKGKSRSWPPPYIGFIYRVGRKPRKIIEIEVFPDDWDNYPAE